MFENISLALLVLKLAFSGILSSLFLQSGMDKIIDYKGNLEWLKGHFSKTFLKGNVPFLLIVIAAMELVTGVLSLIGFGQIIFSKNSQIAFYGSIGALVCLFCLFTAQRIAKDYPGAVSIINYFVAAAFAVIVQGL